MVTSNAKVKVQSFGRFLSNMVMPNIGAFIAWGLITALFIPTGWVPNAALAKLVGPMITYLLPLLIGYTGGRLVGGDCGAIVGAITTMGVIVGSDIPMFLGAMIAGPLGGLTIKKFDEAFDGKVKSGFEMLVNNFSSGIIGMILAIIAFFVIGPAVKAFSSMLAAGVDVLVANNLLPLTSIFVEPAKILFLNNAINHGIFTPLGLQQSQEFGKSIFFLIEANPGPGLGILLAYMFFGRGVAKQTAPGAAIIHFFGGIHEIYFPYVLMKPRLIIAVILAGMSGVATLTIFNAGLVAPASPGSIFAVLLMTPENSYVGVLLSVAISATVSFVLGSILLKTEKVADDADTFESASEQIAEMKSSSKGNNKTGELDYNTLNTIYVSCDAGMGSSAMGAGLLRKKVDSAGLDIKVINCAINDLPKDAQLVITHKDLTSRAVQQVGTAKHLSLTNFLDGALYDKLVADIAEKIDIKHSATPVAAVNSGHKFKLQAEQVFLNLEASSKEEAIQFAGEQLVKAGFVKAGYVDAMLEREKLVSTYLGEGIAVPHGTIEAKDQVIKTGIVFCQYPSGIRFTDEEDDIAKLVIGIAAKNNEHISVVTAITNALDNDEAIKILMTTRNIDEVLKILN